MYGVHYGMLTGLVLRIKWSGLEPGRDHYIIFTFTVPLSPQISCLWRVGLLVMD